MTVVFYKTSFGLIKDNKLYLVSGQVLDKYDKRFIVLINKFDYVEKNGYSKRRIPIPYDNIKDAIKWVKECVRYNEVDIVPFNAPEHYGSHTVIYSSSGIKVSNVWSMI